MKIPSLNKQAIKMVVDCIYWDFRLLEIAVKEKEKELIISDLKHLGLDSLKLLDELIHAIESDFQFLFDREWRYKFCDWLAKYRME